jgi:hypothetical protein
VANWRYIGDLPGSTPKLQPIVNKDKYLFWKNSPSPINDQNIPPTWNPLRAKNIGDANHA